MQNLHTETVDAGCDVLTVDSAVYSVLYGKRTKTFSKIPTIASLNAKLSEEYWGCDVGVGTHSLITRRAVSMRLFDDSCNHNDFIDEWSLKYNPVFLLVAAVHLNGVNPQNPPKGFPQFSSCLDSFKIKDENLILFLKDTSTIVVSSFEPVRLHFFENGLYFCWSSLLEDCICHYVPISCCLVRFDESYLKFLPYSPTYNVIIRTSVCHDRSLLDYYDDFLCKHFDVESANRSWLRRWHLPKRFFKLEGSVFNLQKNIKFLKNSKNLINPYKNICFIRSGFQYGSYLIPEQQFSFVDLFENVSLFLNLFKWEPDSYTRISHSNCNCIGCPKNFCSFNLCYDDFYGLECLEDELEAQVLLSDFLPSMPTVPDRKSVVLGKECN